MSVVLAMALALALTNASANDAADLVAQTFHDVCLCGLDKIERGERLERDGWTLMSEIGVNRSGTKRMGSVWAWGDGFHSDLTIMLTPDMWETQRDGSILGRCGLSVLGTLGEALPLAVERTLMLELNEVEQGVLSSLAPDRYAQARSEQLNPSESVIVLRNSDSLSLLTPDAREPKKTRYCRRPVAMR